MPAAIRFDHVSQRLGGGTLPLDGATGSAPDGVRACLLGGRLAFCLRRLTFERYLA